MNEAYRVALISPADAYEFIRRMNSGPENMLARRSIVLPGGFEIVGEFSMTARDAESGEVEWQHEGKNLITDHGRRVWMENRWNNSKIAFAPSTETPQSGRHSISTDATQCVESAGIGSSNTPATHTKSYSTTFGTPAVNRTLGTIALGYTSATVAVALQGLSRVVAFALLTPPKTQTTTQTLEVTYKVSMNPIG